MNKYVSPACFIGWLVVLLIRPAFTYAAAESVPPLINYQGSLTDANGAPMAGVKSMEFNLYDAPTGGNRKWGPQVYATVPLIGGKFNVLLGPTDSGGQLITTAFADNTRYLSITIEGKEILPRQQILSTPFAMQAERAKNAINALNADALAGVQRVENGVLSSDVPIQGKKGFIFPDNSSQNSAVNVNCHTVYQRSPTVGCGQASVIVNLPAGYFRTGGGCNTSSDRRYLTGNAPNNELGWFCSTQDRDTCHGGFVDAWVMGCRFR